MMTDNSSSRWWDLPAAALLMVALLTTATRLFVTDWTRHLGIMQTLVFFGVIAGLALGYSRFSAKIVFFFAAVYGLFAAPFQLGRTLGPGIEWPERMTILIDRLEIIINQLSKQEVVQDSLLFIVLMAFLFWILGVHAGYTLVRYGNGWKALIPAGMTLFVIHSFDAAISRRAWYLAVFLFFALVLVARTAYLQQHARWQTSRTALPPHLGLDFIRFTLLATAVIVLFSWTAPALASTLPSAERLFLQIKRPWDEMRDRMDNAFASLRSNVGIVSEFYGSSMLLGRGNRLTDAPVFIVRAPEDAPVTQRYYWTARTFDSYRNSQWFSSVARAQAFDPGQDQLVISLDQGRFVGPFEFITASPVSTLFSPGQLTWVSRPSMFEAMLLTDGTIDLSTIRANPPLSAGEVYQVQSSISNATIAQMRAAGEDYPGWVKERYLGLPDTVTQRTRDLAEEITAGLETPYDKAAAITSYLRKNYVYSETVPEPPTRQDLVDWFLFDIGQGFCNYYSSAEIVMLRSLGIPARWAVGFAQGERQEDGSYIVRQRDAHAWPEVYFPGLGWVEFEPTASQPVLVRATGNDSEANPVNSREFQDQMMEEMQDELELMRERQAGSRDIGLGGAQGGLDFARLVWLAPLALGVGLLGYVTWLNRARLNLPHFPVLVESSMIKLGFQPPEIIRSWARQAALPPLSKAYLEINHALSRLGRRPAETDTPSERAASLTQQLPAAEPPSSRLVEAYQKVTFSPINGDQVDVEQARLAGREIRSLSYRAMLAGLFSRLVARLQRPKPGPGRLAGR